MESIIITKICRLVVPFIQLYGLYIVFHGHLTPGGSFSGGAILGSSMILFVLAFGIEEGKKIMPDQLSKRIEIGGVLWFWALGIIGVLVGANFLANRASGIPLGAPGELFSSGLILFITVGLGLKVASTLMSLFLKLAESEGESYGD